MKADWIALDRRISTRRAVLVKGTVFERIVSMESVAGGLEAARGEGTVASIVSRWVAQNDETRRRRPMANERGLPATLRSEAMPAPPLGTRHPDHAGSAPPTLSTEAIMWVMAGFGACFFAGAMAADATTATVRFSTPVAVGPIPENVLAALDQKSAELEAHGEQLQMAWTTIGDMDSAVGLATEQLSACWQEAGR